MVVDGKSSQGYPINAGIPQGSILVPTLFLLYINNLDDFICDIAIYADDTTLCSNVMRHLICGNNLNWLLNLNLIYNTLWTRVRSGLLISMQGKLNWFCLTGLITWFCWYENGWVSSWGKIHLLRCWGWPFFEIGLHYLTLSLSLKLPPRKKLLCISVNLRYAHIWNTVVTSGLMLLFATWNY